MPASLRMGDLALELAIESPRIQSLALTADCDGLQAQVDAHRFLGCFGRLSLLLHRHAQPLVADRILGETALAPFDLVQPL